MKIKKWKSVAIIVLMLILIMAVLVGLNFPKPLILSDSSYNLSHIADGTYVGDCDNGLVKVQVEVDVQNNIISAIRITKHQNGLGSSAEVIISEIVNNQSVEIDAVSGATASSETILKAVENALSENGGKR